MVDADRIELARGSTVQPDAIVETDVGTMDALLWAGGQFAEARRAGSLKIEGDESAVERFLGLFPLPEPVPGVTAS